LGDIYNLPSFGLASKSNVKEIIEENSKLNVYEKYFYSISDKYFALYSAEDNNSIIFYIKYTKNNNTMHIQLMDKVSGIDKNLSIIAYNIILDRLSFDEIETGDRLSDKNISAHKKLLSHIKPFKLYPRYIP